MAMFLVLKSDVLWTILFFQGLCKKSNVKRSSRFGAIPKPTVKVRMRENVVHYCHCWWQNRVSIFKDAL